MSAGHAPVVRVLGGRWKGRKLEASTAARPTSGRARQALVNLLGSRVPGARVLDLYAGSGAVGIELVSRGAASAVLVEPESAPLERSIARIGAAPGEIRILGAAAARAVADLARAGERFDIVFADPPYADGPRLDVARGRGRSPGKGRCARPAGGCGNRRPRAPGARPLGQTGLRP